MIPVALRSLRLVLDQPGAGDLDAITEYCSDPLFEHYMVTPWPYTRTDAEFFVNTKVPQGWASGEEATWAIRESTDGPLLGMIGWRSVGRDVGYWMGAPFRGRGYTAEALATVVEWVFTTTEVAGVLWECRVGNVASASTAHAVGFSFDGEGPALMDYRDGTRPPSWHAHLDRGDELGRKSGWPIDHPAADS